MAKSIDWYYHRNGCVSCKRSQGFLADACIDPKETENAGKAKLGKAEALKLAKGADKIIVAKGKRVTTFNMKKEPPGEAELLKAMLGPTGNLRAPTIRRGKTVLVGFNEEVYRETFG